MEDYPNKKTPEADGELSNAARVLRAHGESEAVSETEEQTVRGNVLENFWYHHKWKVVVIGIFLFMGITLFCQFMNKSNPDVTILYAGPEYITANDNRKFCTVLTNLMEDYNEDGEKKVILNDIIYMTSDQIREAKAAAEEADEDFAYDQQSNAQTSEQFTYEIMAGDSLLCILSMDQYEIVRDADGFLPLSEILDEIPTYALDAYGIPLSQTPFYEYFTISHIFPDDAVIALRRLTTLSKSKGQEKMEKKLEWNKDLFRKIVEFQFPEGYVPTEQDE